MTIQLTVKQTLKLLDFVGYGNIGAPIWFIGMEERGSDLKRIKARLEFEPIMDLKQALQQLGIFHHHAHPYKLQPTWTTMSRVMLTLKGVDATRKTLQDYQANHLGRVGDQTMLTELLPLPAPDTKTWPYARLLPQFPSRKVYKHMVRPPRLRLLSGLIKKYEPAMVVCYGKGAWKHFKAIFPEMEWQDEEPFRWGRWKETHVILTPHFARGYMSKENVIRLSNLIVREYPGVVKQLGGLLDLEKT